MLDPITPILENQHVALFHADAAEFLRQFQCGDGDVIVTDPPYGTGGWRRDCDGTQCLIRENWDVADWSWLHLCQQVPVITFCPAQHSFWLLAEAYEAGYTKVRTMYFCKTNGGVPLAGRMQYTVEPIWVLSRDGFVLCGGKDLFQTSTTNHKQAREFAGHPYQKPLNLMRWIVQKIACKCVIDPFMGSGTTIEAARHEGLSAIGVDNNLDAVVMAGRRLCRRTSLCPFPDLEKVEASLEGAVA